MPAHLCHDVASRTRPIVDLMLKCWGRFENRPVCEIQPGSTEIRKRQTGQGYKNSPIFCFLPAVSEIDHRIFNRRHRKAKGQESSQLLSSRLESSTNCAHKTCHT